MSCKIYVAAICFGLFHNGLSAIAQESNPVPFATSKIDFGTVGLAGDAFVVTTLETSIDTVVERYTVEVPYQETTDGKTETRTRTETRSRQFARKRLVPIVNKIPAEAVAFSSAGGKHIADLSVVRRALASPRSAVITYSTEPLEDFYRQMLNPGTVVIHIDQSKLARKAPPPPAPTPDPAADPDAQ